MGYKMVFSDMDGTLLWKGVRVSVENSAAIRKAVDKGVEFVICTGRGVLAWKSICRNCIFWAKRAMLSARMVRRCMI